MRLVMLWSTSDGATYCNDHVQPFWYASPEAAVCDFEDLVCKYKNSSFEWCGHTFYPSGYDFDTPTFLTVDEWFEKYTNMVR